MKLAEAFVIATELFDDAVCVGVGYLTTRSTAQDGRDCTLTIGVESQIWSVRFN